MRSVVFLVLAAIHAVTASAGEDLPSFLPHQSEDGSFLAQVPAAWSRSDRTPPYADMTTVAGTELIGPSIADGVPATISLFYYQGEGKFEAPDSFINARLGSPVRVDAERGGETAEVQVARRKAVAFRMRTFELVARVPDRPVAGGEGDPRVYEIAPVATKVIMIEQYLVLPAAKGYFVLHYRSPEEIADAYRPIFEKVVASFEPQLR